MNLSVWLKMAAVSVALSVATTAQTYNPATSFEQGFTQQTNPNGVWSYGYSSDFTGAVTLYTSTVQNGINGTNAQYWLSPSNDVSDSPAAEYNDGPAYDDGNIDFLADQFILVSGIGGEYSDLVFTAPMTGVYYLGGNFRGDQYGIGVYVGIVVDGNVDFSSTVTSEGQIVPFGLSASLQAGQTVVFSVGPYNGLQNTGLDLTISKLPLPVTTLVDFSGGNGEAPYAGLIQGLDGNLYGTTAYGGTGMDYGTVFMVTPTGRLTTLYNFCAKSGCPDGAAPLGSLVLGTDSNFYGTTSFGGGDGPPASPGAGTVFKITSKGVLTTLYNFCALSRCADGEYPEGGLVQATDGNFYGTTYSGGALRFGSVFKITAAGKLTTIYSFCVQTGCSDGAGPESSLIQATDGILYGTTSIGGNGYGTVFKITPEGALTTLYKFCSQANCADGEQPAAGLIQASDGNLYGTTHGGGAFGGGTVFKITTAGALTVLYNFCAESGCTDGQMPLAGLTQATDGSLYGSTNNGGSQGYGTLFAITTSGALTTLYNFCIQLGCTDGEFPHAVFQASNGNFYGVTSGGGPNLDGTVYSTSNGLGPFVETVPRSGKVGSKITILGNNLTGATAVSFNGTAATSFKVVSSTEITATIPSGATTGTVTVTTPSGLLISNVVFRIP
jgi:uncharacterized repeat protein (TIGR03803 family)